jgi:hypothetical protein
MRKENAFGRSESDSVWSEMETVVVGRGCD